MNILLHALRRSIAATISGAVFMLAGSATSARGNDLPGDLSKGKLEHITQLLKDAVDQKRIAGGSALIARQDKIAYLTTAGMQDVAGKVPLTESTIFRLASMTKPITAVAVMILVDEGKLRVTDPLSQYLPEFKDMTVLVPSKDGKTYTIVKAAREITIHDLLTHSSGLTYNFINKPFVGQMYREAGISDGLVETPGAIGDNVSKLAKLPLVCQPGAAWEYGLSFDVLGRVVEVASGKTLAEFCRERIFTPLKMNDACFFLSREKWPRLSALYILGPHQILTQLGVEQVTQGSFVFSATVPLHHDGHYYSGGGGLVATLGDYYRFCQMMLNRGTLDGVRILRPETVDLMTQNQSGDLRAWGSVEVGYGVGIVGQNRGQDPASAGSYAGMGAFDTFFWIDPKEALIGIFMAQRSPPARPAPDDDLAEDFKRLTYEALVKRENH